MLEMFFSNLGVMIPISNDFFQATHFVSNRHYFQWRIPNYIRGGCYLVGKRLCRRSIMCSVNKDSRCWWPKWPKPSPTSVTNIEVTVGEKKKLFNFSPNFPTSLYFLTSFFSISCRTFQLKIFQFLVFPNCPFQLHVSPRAPRMGNRNLRPGQYFEHDFLSRE